MQTIKNKIYLFFAYLFISLRNKLTRFADLLVPQEFLLIEKMQKFWLPFILRVAVDLEISDKLEKGAKSIEQLAKETDTNPNFLYRILRALSGEGFYKELKNRTFANNKFSEHFKSNHPLRIKYLTAHQLNDKNIEMFMLLKYSLKTGIPASEKVFGMNPFEYMSKVSENNTLYNNAMEDGTNLLNRTLILHYPFHKFETIADIGGGNGSMLSFLIKNNKQTKGIVFDLPQVIKNINENDLKLKTKQKIQFKEGDFLKSVQIKADLYILKNILHIFSDEICITILKNIKQSAHSGSKIIVLEMDLGNANKKTYGKLYDIQMLITVENGKERTKEEYKNLFEKSGLIFKREIKTVTPFSIFEGVVK